MNIFLDTSSLFKLYHKEDGTSELLSFFNFNKIKNIFLAEISSVEFASVVWKKCRKNELDSEQAFFLLSVFEKDSKNYTFIKDDKNLKALAVNLISKHWALGLRALDAIQLSSALKVKNEIDAFISSDIVLSKIAKLEKFNIEIK